MIGRDVLAEKRARDWELRSGLLPRTEENRSAITMFIYSHIPESDRAEFLAYVNSLTLEEFQQFDTWPPEPGLDCLDCLINGPDCPEHHWDE